MNKLQDVMNQKADAPTGPSSRQVSEVNLDRPNPDSPSDTDIHSFATCAETQKALQANDAEKMTPKEANELSTDNDSLKRMVRTG